MTDIQFKNMTVSVNHCCPHCGEQCVNPHMVQRFLVWQCECGTPQIIYKDGVRATRSMDREIELAKFALQKRLFVEKTKHMLAEFDQKKTIDARVEHVRKIFDYLATIKEFLRVLDNRNFMRTVRAKLEEFERSPSFGYDLSERYRRAIFA